jgi:hypothetical protein
MQYQLTFCLSSMNGCNVGITDERSYHRRDDLGWQDILTNFLQDWFRHLKVTKGGYTYRQAWRSVFS